MNTRRLINFTAKRLIGLLELNEQIAASDFHSYSTRDNLPHVLSLEALRDGNIVLFQLGAHVVRTILYVSRRDQTGNGREREHG